MQWEEAEEQRGGCGPLLPRWCGVEVAPATDGGVGSLTGPGQRRERNGCLNVVET